MSVQRVSDPLSLCVCVLPRARSFFRSCRALAGFLFATIAFIAYLIYQVKVGGEEKFYQEKLTDIVAQKVTEGHVSVGAAFFAFMKEDLQSAEGQAALLLHSTRPSASPGKGRRHRMP